MPGVMYYRALQDLQEIVDNFGTFCVYLSSHEIKTKLTADPIQIPSFISRDCNYCFPDLLKQIFNF